MPTGMYLPSRYNLIHGFEELDELLVEGEVIDKGEDLGLIRIKVIMLVNNCVGRHVLDICKPWFYDIY